jgi:Na+-transporting NADH:ubiquinone oxidoreductase subunit NqrF
MFFTALFSSAQSASMSGYALALWTCTFVSNLTIAVFSLPRRLPHYMMYYPTFPFVRAMYLLIDTCTWEKCYGDYDLMPEEFREMEIIMLLNAFVYTVMAVYLNQVVP